MDTNTQLFANYMQHNQKYMCMQKWKKKLLKAIEMQRGHKAQC